MQDHTESKIRTEIKNGGSLVPELALLTINILLHIVCIKCEEEEDRYTGRKHFLKT